MMSGSGGTEKAVVKEILNQKKITLNEELSQSYYASSEVTKIEAYVFLVSR